MPKIIRQLRPRLLLTARRCLLTQGYTALSLRGIAKECEIAVGTIYNYFPDKNTLIAAVMLEDWHIALQQMDSACAAAGSAEQGFLAICQAIREFAGLYREVWAQFAQTGGSAGEVDSRHRLLRGQLEARLTPLLEKTGHRQLAPMVPLLAETVLAAAVQTDIGSEQLAAFIRRLAP